MTQRRTRRSLSARRRRGGAELNTRLIAMIGGGIVVLGLLIWGIVALAGGGQAAASTTMNEAARFVTGVKVADMDVSGMSRDEAIKAVEPIANQMVAGYTASYTVNDKTYTLTGEQMGATCDYESVVDQALQFGNEADEATKEANVKLAKESGKNFPISVTLNKDTLLATLSENGKEYNTEPVNATVKVDKSQNEDSLTCSGKLVYEDGTSGMTVDDSTLADELIKAAESGDKTPIVAQLKEAEPTITKESLQENLTLRAQYDTNFVDSPYERRYNVWKMATVVNGVSLQPGETWSINEAAGDRTEANGWKAAPGITDGGYTDQYGGGICQVSSTLYIALLKSEYQIVTRKHHSWPVTYVPKGLDATISTGGPDFKFKNNYDYPVVILVTCDAGGSKNIKIQVYGPKMDYKVKFETELLENSEPSDAPQTVFNASVAPGKYEWTKPRKNLIRVQVYKIKYNDSGEISREEFSVETYKSFAGQISFGPTSAVQSKAEESARASASGGGGSSPSAEASATKQATASATKKAEASATKKAEATKTAKPEKSATPTQNGGVVVG